ncbi:hypothetical protein K1719_042854 [Acacia pycnantha]|nr:hypothetical protein K1719_042854 [Acacia pycnantha]
MQLSLFLRIRNTSKSRHLSISFSFVTIKSEKPNYVSVVCTAQHIVAFIVAPNAWPFNFRNFISKISSISPVPESFENQTSCLTLSLSLSKFGRYPNHVIQLRAPSVRSTFLKQQFFASISGLDLKLYLACEWLRKAKKKSAVVDSRVWA